MKKLFIFFFLFISYFASCQQIEKIVELKADNHEDFHTDNFIHAKGIDQYSKNELIPTINSESNVNNSGSFSHVIPIEVFKGVNDLQPNISLVYNSQIKGGIPGEGWSILYIRYFFNNKRREKY